MLGQISLLEHGLGQLFPLRSLRKRHLVRDHGPKWFAAPAARWTARAGTCVEPRVQFSYVAVVGFQGARARKRTFHRRCAKPHGTATLSPQGPPFPTTCRASNVFLFTSSQSHVGSPQGSPHVCVKARPISPSNALFNACVSAVSRALGTKMAAKCTRRTRLFNVCQIHIVNASLSLTSCFSFPEVIANDRMLSR